MLEIGRHQTLRVARKNAIGAFLASATDEVLLPRKYVPRGVGIGDSVRVFVHHDSEDRPVATTLTPAATLGEIAVMTVVDVTRHGAFVDWGLDKDLFVPEIEQHRPLKPGSRAVVEVRLDRHTGRLIGSTRLGRFFDPVVDHLQPGREVRLLVWAFNDAGAQVVVEQRHAGIVYASQVPAGTRVGDALVGYVERLRPDGKVDVSLRKLGRAASIDAQEVILAALEASDDRFLPLHDGSTPEAIRERLDLSKRVFKAAVGGLYRRGAIELLPEGIRLTPSDPEPEAR